MAYRIRLGAIHPGPSMWRAGKLFTKEPVRLTDDDAVAAILREPMFVIEDLGRDSGMEASITETSAAPADEAVGVPEEPAHSPSFFKRRRRS